LELAWLIMVGITNSVNFSNYPKMKLVSILNKLGVAHMVVQDVSHNNQG
jgi:hypothetical protein